MKTYSSVARSGLVDRLLHGVFASVLVFCIAAFATPSWSEGLSPSRAGAVGHCKTNWLYQGEIGLSTHYFPLRSDKREAVANALQVKKVAEQAAEAGASWFLLTIHHRPWIMMAPNATYDRIVGNDNYTTKRDVPMELARELQSKGIKLMLYVNLRIDPKSVASAEVRQAMGGWPPSDVLFRNIAAVYREFSLRYGDKVSGWWVDAAFLPEYKNSPNRERWFRMLADALRAGNPSALVTFNPGVTIQRYTGSEDYTAGESEELKSIPSNRWLDGVQWHMWTFLGGWWASGGTRFSERQLGDFVSQVTGNGGAITFDVGTRGINFKGRPKESQPEDRTTTPHVGYIDPIQVEQIKAIMKYRQPPAARQLANCIN